MFWNKKNKERFDKVPDTSVVFEATESNIEIPVFSTPLNIPKSDDNFKIPEAPSSIIMPDEVLLKTPNTEESLAFNIFDEKKDKAENIKNKIAEKQEDILKETKDSSNDLINKYEEDNFKLKKELESLKKDYNTLKNENINLEAKINKLNIDNTKLKQDLSNLKNNENIINSSELDKAKFYSDKYEALVKTHEELKAKIRHDIRKIRMREKELSNRVELIKQDRDTLLAAKDQKILKLNKQIDDLEFQKEALNEINTKLKKESKDYYEKTQRVIKALRLSTSLLESEEK